MALTTREKDFSAWYNELVVQADLAHTSAVRWCMVIKPYWYWIWENIQKYLDMMFKKTWHSNAYFPLFIPKSFFSKEAKHVEWFATEAAVVTHYRLKRNEEGKIVVDPQAKLEEELIVRPTSETIIWNTYKDWIQSYRDLPILVNQWANVVRREMRTRLFLRTAEFLWQEGHTAHATQQEAIEETKKMWQVYIDMYESFLAISGWVWEKSENERFAGAENTYTVEAMMQDWKALQGCTSHFLGQNFWKAFDVTFVDKENKQDYAWATSWGFSTRTIWGLIMSHSDDKWLVLPPAIAPIHVVIIPIYKSDEDRQKVFEKINFLSQKNINFVVDSKFLWAVQIPVIFKIDDSDKTPGWKYNQYELQWIPLRISIGPRDIDSWEVEIFSRIENEKQKIKFEDLENFISQNLAKNQKLLLEKTKAFREKNTVKVDSYEDFKKALEIWKFVLAHWDWTIETEELIKQETKATIRCIPEIEKEEWICIRTWKPSTQRVIFALAY